MITITTKCIDENDVFPKGVSGIIENTMTALMISGLTFEEAKEAMENKFSSLKKEKQNE